MTEGIRTQKAATPEEIAQIDAALEQTGGNRAHAAVALKMDPKRVYNLVYSDPHLKAKWGRDHPDAVEPSLATEIHREPALEPFSPGDEAVVVALEKQDQLLQKGWAKLGFDGKERKFLAGLQATYAGNLKSTLDLSYGGAAHANTRLLLALEDVRERLKDIEANPDNYSRSYQTEHGTRETKSHLEYWHETYQLFVSISSELRKMSEGVTKANALRLQMEKLRLQSANADKKKQAGWGPDGPKKAETVDVETQDATT